MGLSLTLRTTRTSASLGYDLTVGGRPVVGTLSFDKTSSVDPKQLITDAVKGEAVKVLKVIYPSMASYIN